jgi:hypothetical protein
VRNRERGETGKKGKRRNNERNAVEGGGAGGERDPVAPFGEQTHEMAIG